MKYKAIIFDMDGTIINTEHIWEYAVRTVIERRGKQLTRELEIEINRQLCGLGLPESCKALKEIMKLDDDLDALMKEKSNLARSFYENKVEFIEGFLSFHKKASSLQLKIGLATNADDATLSATKKRLNLEQLFGSHMYNISHVNNKCKPDPALYLFTAQQLEVNPEECIAIEDSAHGIQAAVKAGLFCIGINTSKNPYQIKDSHTTIDHYDEIDLKQLLSLK